MENYQGDLADIIRASGEGAMNGSIPGEVSVAAGWPFPSNQIDYASGVEEPLDEFGVPFSNVRDPLLHEIDMLGSGFFNSSTDIIRPSVANTGGFCGDGSSTILTQKIVADETRRPINNIFSRMLQISPNAQLLESPRDSSLVPASPRGLEPSMLVPSNDMINTVCSKGSLVENAGVQISSPRNTGIKRRKSQAKKVVCIPAPAPANSRQSGEVVPSDLWAWRKYGQKPIKGSPYPRGYYRCSSSKGCSARKQVERSRTDPNMLVITYTSEHNHPWPTQRNVLAGSTRSQPSKNGSASRTSTSSEAQKATILKEERKKSHTENVSPSMVTVNPMICPSVKDETEPLDKQMEIDDVEFFQGFPQSYKPALPDTSQTEDFFADLGELESDPLNLLFAQGYSRDEAREDKSLDPFNFYDWTGNSTTSTGNNRNNTSVNEAKKGS